MTTKNLFLLAFFGIFCGSSMGADASIASRVFLGKTLLDHHSATPIIEMVGGCPSQTNPMVHKIQLRVRGAAANIDHLLIQFQTGKIIKYSIREQFGRNSQSNWMDFAGGHTCLKAVQIIGETSNPRSKRAVVELWGLN